jgi:hypothetical protein
VRVSTSVAVTWEPLKYSEPVVCVPESTRTAVPHTILSSFRAKSTPSV